MIAGLTPKQLRLTIAFALLIYGAVLAAVIAWVMFNAEDTVKARIAASPSATVSLTEEAPAVPSSWQAPEAMPSAEETPLPEDEAAPAETPAPEAVETPKDSAEQAPAPTAEKEAAPAAAVTPAEPAQPPVTVNRDASPSAAWHKYARPFNQADRRPRIALIIADLGMASGATQAAIQELPGDISLAFSSTAPNLEQWIGSARAAGHETILTIPMEPENYPQNDPGPNSLLTGLSNEQNIDRLKRAMARAEGYVAIAPYMGDKFVISEPKLIPVLQTIKQEEVLILDGTMNRNSLIAPLARYEGIPFVRSDAVIDAAASSTAIDAQLQQLEQTALEKGQAVGVALPYPVTFEKLKSWTATLEKKGLVLAPLTALVGDNAPAAVTPAAAQ